MSCIVYQTNKKTGVTYAYESVSYWDKEKSNQDPNVNTSGELMMRQERSFIKRIRNPRILQRRIILILLLF